MWCDITEQIDERKVKEHSGGLRHWPCKCIIPRSNPQLSPLFCNLYDVLNRKVPPKMWRWKTCKNTNKQSSSNKNESMINWQHVRHHSRRVLFELFSLDTDLLNQTWDLNKSVIWMRFQADEEHCVPECRVAPAAWQHWDCWRPSSPLLCWGKPGRRWVCSPWRPLEAFQRDQSRLSDWWKDLLGPPPPGTSVWPESWCRSDRATPDLLPGCSSNRWVGGRKCEEKKETGL